jgi:hypothetical protein
MPAYLKRVHCSKFYLNVTFPRQGLPGIDPATNSNEPLARLSPMGRILPDGSVG